MWKEQQEWSWLQENTHFSWRKKNGKRNLMNPPIRGMIYLLNQTDNIQGLRRRGRRTQTSSESPLCGTMFAIIRRSPHRNFSLSKCLLKQQDDRSAKRMVCENKANSFQSLTKTNRVLCFKMDCLTWKHWNYALGRSEGRSSMFSFFRYPTMRIGQPVCILALRSCCTTIVRKEFLQAQSPW